VQDYRLTDKNIIGKPALIVGVAGLGLSMIGYFMDPKQFFYSYLVAYVFWTTLALGALFFTLLHHLTGAEWSTVLRRISESVMISFPILAVLFIPVALGMHDLYHWTHTDVVVNDKILSAKAPYLNVTFFIIRTVAYFAIWTFLSWRLHKLSLEQDSNPSPELRKKFRKTSAPGMLLFAVTITFAGFDWLMSLDPHWYSTIFGVYVFGGSLLAIYSFLIIFGLVLRRRNILQDTITVEHYHDLGKFLFAFTIFWGYIGFSQYFLIWYANIPEETIWYLYRWEGSWSIITMIIVLGHFLIPFILLMPRANKRNLKFLNIMAIWIFVMHWIDIYWLVMPNLQQQGFQFSWMDLTLTLGIGGVFMYWFWQKLSANALVAMNDPSLEVSINFTNN